MSMTKRFAVSFDLKLVITETDIQDLINTMSNDDLPSGTKNPIMLSAMSCLRHSETEEDKRIYAERLIELSFRGLIREELKEKLASLWGSALTMSNPKVSVIK